MNADQCSLHIYICLDFSVRHTSLIVWLSACCVTEDLFEEPTQKDAAPFWNCITYRDQV